MNKSLEHGRNLLQKARDDRYVLVRLIPDPQAPLWTIAFHAQQAVEKAIKAVLSIHGIEYPRTHNIGWLLDTVKDNELSLPEGADGLPLLTPFGVAFRYDDDMLTGLDEAPLSSSQLLTLVEQTLAWAEKQVNYN